MLRAKLDSEGDSCCCSLSEVIEKWRRAKSGMQLRQQRSLFVFFEQLLAFVAASASVRQQHPVLIFLNSFRAVRCFRTSAIAEV